MNKDDTMPKNNTFYDLPPLKPPMTLESLNYKENKKRKLEIDVQKSSDISVLKQIIVDKDEEINNLKLKLNIAELQLQIFNSNSKNCLPQIPGTY